MNLRVSLILALLLTLGTRVALAQPADDEKRAREFFALGKYAEALELYGRLYAETAHPTYLRNIGRCFQNLGEPDKAISSFREYLRQARNATPEQRSQVEGYIREMEELKRKREAPAPPPPPRPSPTASGPPHRDPESLAAPDGSFDGRRLGAYVATGGAVVALGVGTVFGLRAISRRKDSDPLCPNDHCNDQGFALDQQAHRAAIVSDVAFGAGLAAAGVATYLFLTSTDAAPEESPRRVQVRVAIGPRAAAVGVGGRW
jgi:tetratricopeptide (TPR) repeat protein